MELEIRTTAGNLHKSVLVQLDKGNIWNVGLWVVYSSRILRLGIVRLGVKRWRTKKQLGTWFFDLEGKGVVYP